MFDLNQYYQTVFLHNQSNLCFSISDELCNLVCNIEHQLSRYLFTREDWIWLYQLGPFQEH